MPSYSFKKHTAGRRWPKVLLLVLAMLFVIAIGTVVVIRKTYTDNLRPISASQKAQLITVPNGAGAKQIGQMLQDAGLIRKAWAFEWYVRNNGLRDSLQAGTYSISPNQTVEDIATILTHGKIATDLVTILPAQRLDQIKAALINSGFSASAVERALDASLYTDHPALVDKPAGASLEGYLYPETFQRTANTDPETIIRLALDETQKYLTPELRAGIVKQGLTVHQGIILASIIEQEVSNPDDKPVVAQVFLKRIRQGMQLGSDVTAFYGAIVDDVQLSDNISEATRAALNHDSPYNTRMHNGLPPGPISNVSGSSLRAVANPATSDYLFFVAGDDGKTYFSQTVQEHEQLTRDHCKKLCQ